MLKSNAQIFEKLKVELNLSVRTCDGRLPENFLLKLKISERFHFDSENMK